MKRSLYVWRSFLNSNSVLLTIMWTVSEGYIARGDGRKLYTLPW